MRPTNRSVFDKLRNNGQIAAIRNEACPFVRCRWGLTPDVAPEPVTQMTHVSPARTLSVTPPRSLRGHPDSQTPPQTPPQCDRPHAPLRQTTGQAAVQTTGQTMRVPPTRQVRITWRGADGGTATREALIPASPLFETAFNAFARGTLIATVDGPVAVEDLVPGNLILTQDHDALPLLWMGSMTMTPDAPTDYPELGGLTRVLTDHFAPGRPFADLLLGPGARLLGRDEAGQVLVPASSLQDGLSVFPLVPRHPVQLHHLMLPQHAIILAGGVAVETWHPGAGLGERTGAATLAFLLTLLPHLRDLADLGAPCLRRAPLLDRTESGHAAA